MKGLFTKKNAAPPPASTTAPPPPTKKAPPPPPPSSESATSTGKDAKTQQPLPEGLKEKLIAFYTLHDAKKVDELDKILAKVAGNGVEWLQAGLMRKYKAMLDLSEDTSNTDDQQNPFEHDVAPPVPTVPPPTMTNTGGGGGGGGGGDEAFIKTTGGEQYSRSNAVTYPSAALALKSHGLGKYAEILNKRGVVAYEDLATIVEDSADPLWSQMPPFPDKKKFRQLIADAKAATSGSAAMPPPSAPVTAPAAAAAAVETEPPKPIPPTIAPPPPPPQKKETTVPPPPPKKDPAKAAAPPPPPKKEVPPPTAQPAPPPPPTTKMQSSKPTSSRNLTERGGDGDNVKGAGASSPRSSLLGVDSNGEIAKPPPASSRNVVGDRVPSPRSSSLRATTADPAHDRTNTSDARKRLGELEALLATKVSEWEKAVDKAEKLRAECDEAEQKAEELKNQYMAFEQSVEAAKAALELEEQLREEQRVIVEARTAAAAATIPTTEEEEPLQEASDGVNIAHTSPPPGAFDSAPIPSSKPLPPASNNDDAFEPMDDTFPVPTETNKEFDPNNFAAQAAALRPKLHHQVSERKVTGPQPDPCDSFTLDMTAAKFGACVCGHDKKSHKSEQGIQPKIGPGLLTKGLSKRGPDALGAVVSPTATTTTLTGEPENKFKAMQRTGSAKGEGMAAESGTLVLQPSGDKLVRQPSGDKLTGDKPKPPPPRPAQAAAAAAAVTAPVPVQEEEVGGPVEDDEDAHGGGDDDDPENIDDVVLSPKERMVVFYRKYNPDKLDEIDKILAKFVGREEELFLKLEKKYPGSKI